MKSNTHKLNCQNLFGVVFGILMTLIICNAVLIYYIYKQNGLVTLQAVDDISAITPHYYYITDDEKEFRAELSKLNILEKQGEAQVLAILHWVMSLTDKVENNPENRGIALIASARQGHGFICGDSAQVFFEALRAANIPARRIILKRSMFHRYDTHVTVEAWVEGSWRVYDPTFHIVFEDTEGERVGIHEVRDWYLRKSGSPINIKFLGEVKFPSRIENYYISYSTLLNTVFVEQRGNPSKLEAIINGDLPTADYYYKRDKNLDQSDIIFFESIYAFAIKIIPSMTLALILALILFLLYCKLIFNMKNRKA